MEYEWHRFNPWDGRPFSTGREAPPEHGKNPWKGIWKRLPLTLVMLALLVVGVNLLLLVSLPVSLLCARPGSRCRELARRLSDRVMGRPRRRWAA